LSELEEASRTAKPQLERLWEALVEQWPMLLGGAACLVSGVILLFDDVKDFGDLSRPHHYMWGILLVIGGAIFLAAVFTRIILRLF
jgi:drug/metabolite transporter (DMT)-like permease